jgi:hypothetical protein
VLKVATPETKFRVPNNDVPFLKLTVPVGTPPVELTVTVKVTDVAPWRALGLNWTPSKDAPFPFSGPPEGRVSRPFHEGVM